MLHISISEGKRLWRYDKAVTLYNIDLYVGMSNLSNFFLQLLVALLLLSILVIQKPVIFWFVPKVAAALSGTGTPLSSLHCHHPCARVGCFVVCILLILLVSVRQRV